MSKSEQEIEAKFLVRDLGAVASRLQALGAHLTSPRVHELNLRFDTPDGALGRAGRVLRLRQDNAAILTYKGPARPGESVTSRQEIEFQVSDLQSARHFIEALGYQVAVTYEKYRTTYDMGDCEIVLDEMPYGSFVEIEGPAAEPIQAVASALGLNWAARGTGSYIAIFTHLQSALGRSIPNLTFADLQGIQARPEDLGLRFAD